MSTLEFTVIYPPTSLKRHRHSRFGKHTYDPSANEKKEFVSKMSKWLPTVPMTGPIKAELRFYEKRPKSHYRTGKFSNQLKPSAPEYNVSKRDIDNFVKFVFDSLNKLMYMDDSQIFELTCSKYYSDEPNGYIYGKFIEIYNKDSIEEVHKEEVNIEEEAVNIEEEAVNIEEEAQKEEEVNIEEEAQKEEEVNIEEEAQKEEEVNIELIK